VPSINTYTSGYVLVAEKILSGLRNEILTGTLKPGERIRQEAVGAQYGASRIPVRQALQQLQAEGLITLTAHVGARVAALNRDELHEIYKIRECLEPLALAESTPHLSAETLDMIRDLGAQMEAVGPTNRTEWIVLDRNFHLTTYSGAQLPRLTRMIDGLWNATQQYRLAYTALPETMEVAHTEHRLLLEALVRRDSVDASRLTEMHIRRTRLTLISRPELFDDSMPNSTN
jgi:DNA-binding GntR family transcriptional regulator